MSKCSRSRMGAAALVSIAACAGILMPTLHAQCGDCDGSGRVDILDALLAARAGSGLATLPTMAAVIGCDVDASGAINILDALQIARHASAQTTPTTCLDPVGDGFVMVSRVSIPGEWIAFNLVTWMEKPGSLRFATPSAPAASVFSDPWHAQWTVRIFDVNSHTGSISPVSSMAISDPPRLMRSGDLDGDGSPDLVLSLDTQTSDPTGRIFLGDAAGVMSFHGEVGDWFRQYIPYWVVDLNGDGRDDVMEIVSAGVCPPTTYPLPWFADEAGSLLRGAPVSASSPACLGDVDGDGDQDLVTFPSSAYAGGCGVLLNDGQGGFLPGATVALPRPSGDDLIVILGDIDGDGDLDIVGDSRFDATTALARNDGSGRFSVEPPVPLSSPVESSAWKLADLDGDGALDLIHRKSCGAPTSPETFLWARGNGTGTFQSMSTVQLSPHLFGGAYLPVVADLRDLDGDGDLDALVVDADGDPGSSSGALEVWMNCRRP